MSQNWQYVIDWAQVITAISAVVGVFVAAHLGRKGIHVARDSLRGMHDQHLAQRASDTVAAAGAVYEAVAAYKAACHPLFESGNLSPLEERQTGVDMHAGIYQLRAATLVLKQQIAALSEHSGNNAANADFSKLAKQAEADSDFVYAAAYPHYCAMRETDGRISPERSQSEQLEGILHWIQPYTDSNPATSLKVEEWWAATKVKDSSKLYTINLLEEAERELFHSVSELTTEVLQRTHPGFH